MKFILETKRLIVKAPSYERWDEVYALFSDPEVTSCMGGPSSEHEIYSELKQMICHFNKHGFSMGDVFEKGSGAYVGQAGLVYLALDDTQPEIEVGYILHKAFWNKGYATELTSAFLIWGFQNLPVKSLIGVTRPHNKRSSRVLEKAGMRYVGNIYCRGVELMKYVIGKDEINTNV